MTSAEIVPGRCYLVKVSGTVVPVKVLRTYGYTIRPGHGGTRQFRDGWICRSEVTGREIRVKSPQRFRGASDAGPASRNGQTVPEAVAIPIPTPAMSEAPEPHRTMFRCWFKDGSARVVTAKDAATAKEEAQDLAQLAATDLNTTYAQYRTTNTERALEIAREYIGCTTVVKVEVLGQPAATR